MSYSRTPLSTAQVREVVGVKRSTLTGLEELLAARKVGHCRITKGLEAVDYWWMVGNCLGDAHGHSYRRKKK